MFGLGGISGYLFRPMAKAVIFALIASYLLSRTLVPTMANYLLGGHCAMTHDAPRAAAFRQFQRGFEHRFEALRRATPAARAGARRWMFIIGFLGLRLWLRWRFCLFSARISFRRAERSAQIACARADWPAHRGNGTAFQADRDRDPRDRGPQGVTSMVDNIGLPVSGINMAYGNSGTIGPADGDILITLGEGQEDKGDDLVQTLARKTAAAISRARPSPSCPPTSSRKS